MYEVCERYGVKFNLGTQRRFTLGYIKMREIVESGGIGERRVVIAYSGGGALWTYTHAADMLLFLASDSEVEYVQGNVAVSDADFEDNRTESDPNIIMGYIRFKNGTHGISIPGSAYEFEVDCSNGTVRALNNGQGFQLRKRQGQWNEILDADFPRFELKSGTVGCIEDIVEAIDTDRETKGNIRLARISTEITFGIVDSQRQKGARVYMPMENRSLYLGRW
jgi:predicted dehydrogenase